MKGRTQWTPRSVEPVRNGVYECVVRISRAVPPMIWMLEWDGKGFLVEIPMIVLRWRGMTKKAHDEELRRIGGKPCAT
ncbi:hypothetical protein CHELA1G11_10880 [Hyphomicrobiales bacterium]|nr:hypothetical protein CHELA1G11_10880 [Hyphomicrobiales bacterium]